MYSLVAVLSVLACASFVLAFVHGRRRHLWLLGLWCVLLLYAHNWALFLLAGLAAAWLWLWHEGRVGVRDGALLAGGVALLYAPWVPSLALPGLQHRGAVGVAALGAEPAWASRASCSGSWPCRCWRWPPAPRSVAAGRRRARGCWRWSRPSPPSLAFLGSQLEPAWAPRYFAVLFGPLLLALAAVLSRGAGWTWVALAGVVAIWLASGPAPAKSNVRTVADDGRARAAAGRSRRLHPAGAGPGAVPLPPRRPALPHPARARRGPAADGLARRRGADAGRHGGAGARAAGGRAPARPPHPAGHARRPAPVAGAVEPRGAQPHARVARLAAREPAPAPARPRPALDLAAAAERGADASCSRHCRGDHRLLLVRHGESTWNAEHRLQGQADPPLSELGREQAQALAAVPRRDPRPPAVLRPHARRPDRRADRAGGRADRRALARDRHGPVGRPHARRARSRVGRRLAARRALPRRVVAAVPGPRGRRRSTSCAART